MATFYLFLSIIVTMMVREASASVEWNAPPCACWKTPEFNNELGDNSDTCFDLRFGMGIGLRGPPPAVKDNTKHWAVFPFAGGPPGSACTQVSWWMNWTLMKNASCPGIATDTGSVGMYVVSSPQTCKFCNSSTVSRDCFSKASAAASLGDDGWHVVGPDQLTAANNYTHHVSFTRTLDFASSPIRNGQTVNLGLFDESGCDIDGRGLMAISCSKWEMPPTPEPPSSCPPSAKPVGLPSSSCTCSNQPLGEFQSAIDGSPCSYSCSCARNRTLFDMVQVFETRDYDFSCCTSPVVNRNGVLFCDTGDALDSLVPPSDCARYQRARSTSTSTSSSWMPSRAAVGALGFLNALALLAALAAIVLLVVFKWCEGGHGGRPGTPPVVVDDVELVSMPSPRGRNDNKV